MKRVGDVVDPKDLRKHLWVWGQAMSPLADGEGSVHSECFRSERLVLRRVGALQGHLTHKKTQPPRILP